MFRFLLRLVQRDLILQRYRIDRGLQLLRPECLVALRLIDSTGNDRDLIADPRGRSWLIRRFLAWVVKGLHF